MVKKVSLAILVAARSGCKAIAVAVGWAIPNCDVCRGVRRQTRYYACFLESVAE